MSFLDPSGEAVKANRRHTLNLSNAVVTKEIHICWAAFLNVSHEDLDCIALGYTGGLESKAAQIAPQQTRPLYCSAGLETGMVGTSSGG